MPTANLDHYFELYHFPILRAILSGKQDEARRLLGDIQSIKDDIVSEGQKLGFKIWKTWLYAHAYTSSNVVDGELLLSILTLSKNNSVSNQRSKALESLACQASEMGNTALVKWIANNEQVTDDYWILSLMTLQDEGEDNVFEKFKPFVAEKLQVSDQDLTALINLFRSEGRCEKLGKPVNKVRNQNSCIVGVHRFVQERLNAFNNLKEKIKASEHPEIKPIIIHIEHQLINQAELIEKYAFDDIMTLDSYLDACISKLMELIKQDEELKQHSSECEELAHYFDFEHLRQKVEMYFAREKQAVIRENWHWLHSVISSDLAQMLAHIAKKDVPALTQKFNEWKQKGWSVEKLDRDIQDIFSLDNFVSMMLLVEAARTGSIELVDSLISLMEHSNTNEVQIKLLLVAISFNQNILAEHLLKRLPKEIVGEIAETILQFSLQSQNKEFIKLLSSVLKITTIVSDVEPQMKRYISMMVKTESRDVISSIQKLKYLLEQLQDDDDKQMKQTISMLKKLIKHYLKQIDCGEEYRPDMSLVSSLWINLQDILLHRIISDDVRDEIEKTIKTLEGISGPNDADMMEKFVTFVAKYKKVFTKVTLSQVNEDSTIELSADEHSIIFAVKNKYKDKFDEKTQEKILSDLESYLVAQFELAGLTKEYNPDWSDEEKQQYYQNPHHTAWRYLFARPINHWMNPNAQWAKNHAAIKEEYITLLAYFWLAVTDQDAQPVNKFTIDDRIIHFIEELAFLEREHNWDRTHFNEQRKQNESYDDLKADDPACVDGILRRISHLLIGHPIVEEVSAISPEDIAKRFHESLVAIKRDESTIYSQLEECDLPTLDKLQNALTDYVTKREVAPYETISTLQSLRVKPESFLQSCYERWGKDAIDNDPVEHQDYMYPSYRKFIKKMSKEPYQFFSCSLDSKIKIEIRGKQKPSPAAEPSRDGHSLK